MISCAQTLRLVALAASLSGFAPPSSAKDIVAFVDEATAQVDPNMVLVLQNNEAAVVNTADTIVTRLNAKGVKYDLQSYHQGDRPKEVARPIDWSKYGAVFCMGQAMDCDLIHAQANNKGFEGAFYNAMLEKRV